MALFAGIDIGSTASKVVLLCESGIVARVVGPSSASPRHTAQQIYDQVLAEHGVEASDVALVVGTGYGRTLVPFAHRNISEITCHGRGAHALVPTARTVVDIGGQDTKVITLDGQGGLLDFGMNDKCAAGTGRFLEAMARALEISFEAMAADYFGDAEPRTVTSMCSVFAESEVISLINDGVSRASIVKGLLRSLAVRVASLARRQGLCEEVVMSGGLAKNDAIVSAVQEKLGVRFAALNEDPQIVGALGAALIARDFVSQACGAA